MYYGTGTGNRAIIIFWGYGVSKLFFCDLETDGTDPVKNNIIEFAAIYFDKSKNESEEFHIFIKHEKYADNYDEVAEKSHGITKEFLEKNGLIEADAYIQIVRFISSKADPYDKKDKMIFGGYNATFDNQFLRELYLRYCNNYFGSFFFSPRIDVLSTVAESISLGKLPVLENFKLETVAKHLNIDLKAHSAIEDIKATIEVYKKLRYGK